MTLEVRIPDDFLDLLEQPVVGMVATSDSEGRPAVSPVWIEYRDGLVTFSTAASTLKARHLAANEKVAICVLDPADDLRFVEIAGTVVNMTDQGAHEHLDAMTERYWATPAFPGHDYGASRYLVKVRPERVAVSAPVSTEVREIVARRAHRREASEAGDVGGD